MDNQNQGFLPDNEENQDKNNQNKNENKTLENAKNSDKKSFMKEWVLPLLAEIIIVLLLIKYVFFITVVPTGSMLPTVQLHSWLFATRVHNPEKSVQRGDIIVFKSDETDTILLKRCVGLPGETVFIQTDGKVYINGSLYEEEYVKNQAEGEAMEFQIPQGHFFFLGDNRASSIDARYWDNPYIPEDKIMGEARFTLYPFTNFGVLK